MPKEKWSGYTIMSELYYEAIDEIREIVAAATATKLIKEEGYILIKVAENTKITSKKSGIEQKTQIVYVLGHKKPITQKPPEADLGKLTTSLKNSSRADPEGKVLKQYSRGCSSCGKTIVMREYSNGWFACNTDNSSHRCRQ